MVAEVTEQHKHRFKWPSLSRIPEAEKMHVEKDSSSASTSHPPIKASQSLSIPDKKEKQKIRRGKSLSSSAIIEKIDASSANEFSQFSENDSNENSPPKINSAQKNEKHDADLKKFEENKLRSHLSLGRLGSKIVKKWRALHANSHNLDESTNSKPTELMDFSINEDNAIYEAPQKTKAQSSIKLSQIFYPKEKPAKVDSSKDVITVSPPSDNPSSDELPVGGTGISNEDAAVSDVQQESKNKSKDLTKKLKKSLSSAMRGSKNVRMTEQVIPRFAENRIVLEGPDRFSLLLLEEDEYYFTDFFCHFHPLGGSQRVAGHLKVCSASFFFVPQNSHEPIFRVEFCNTVSFERPENVRENQVESEEFFVIIATERTDMKTGNRNTPYRVHKGDFSFHFSLVYTSLNDMLPKVKKLFEIANHDTEERSFLLKQLIQEHEEQVKFNPGWFHTGDEKIELELVGNRITPLVSQPGRIVLSASSVYFQPFNVVSSAPVLEFKLNTIIAVMRRKYQLEDIGIELFFTQWSSIYFTFKTMEECMQFHSVLLTQPGIELENMKSRDQWINDWIHGKISNFDYLMYLNREANRSFNDLSQYPIFPWVIADYTSKTLDLSNSETFRDLSKPIGALSPERLEGFKQRYYELSDAYEMWKEEMDESDSSIVNLPGTPSLPFLYGSHYSTPGYVVYFRVRDQPQLMLRLQNGRYDMPDRLLNSISETWEGVLNNPMDVKELIPEFYALTPNFLLNAENLNFGIKQTGEQVNHVELPPWAEDATDFCKKLRQALECPYVSKRLNKWIDLIFGFKQRGEDALLSDNIFHPLTYDDIGMNILNSPVHPDIKQALRVQMLEFGRVPSQLFLSPHPKQLRHEIRWMNDYVKKCKKVFSHPFHHYETDLPHLFPRTLEYTSAQFKDFSMEFFRRPSLIPPSPSQTESRMVESKSLSRVLQRIASSDPSVHLPALKWIEQTANYLDKEVLEILHVRHLSPLHTLLTSKKLQKKVNAVRALAALSQLECNRRFIMASGLFEYIDKFVASEPPQGLIYGIECMGLLSSDDLLRNKISGNSVVVLVSALSTNHVRESKERTGEEEEAMKEEDRHIQMLMESYGDDAELEENDVAENDARVYVCLALSNIAMNPRHRIFIIRLNCIPVLLHLAVAGEEHSSELRENAMRALAKLIEEEDARIEVVKNGGLQLALKMCTEDVGGPQEASMWLLASLSNYESYRCEIAAKGGLRLLCNASCAAQRQVQEAAASTLKNLCTDPTIINSAVREEGLWSLIAMAESPNLEVQRLSAKAFWQLAFHHENKRQVMTMGGLQTLIKLSELGERNIQASLLAEEALTKLADDPEIQRRLTEEASKQQHSPLYRYSSQASNRALTEDWGGSSSAEDFSSVHSEPLGVSTPR